MAERDGSVVEPGADEYDPDVGDRDEATNPAGQGPSGHSAGDGSPSGSGAGGGGEGEAAGSGGPGDPLYDRAVAFYRARLVAWFSSRFRVSGSRLTQDELRRYRVRVRIQLSEERIVESYTVLSSDHPAFTKAARATLDALRGQTLPPPPDNYPGAVQRQITVTFACPEEACE